MLGGIAPARADGFLITEFMAANASSEKDEDGEYSDWIEIYNSDSSSPSLGGWSLTDDPANLRKWVFPSLNLNARTYALVFASGKNRTNALTKLHTNFKLSREGGYLALVRPDGQLASVFASYPAQLTDVSFGIGVAKDMELLLGADAPARLLIPSTAGLTGLAWRQAAYDDSAWTSVTNGVGYDRIPAGQKDSTEPPAPNGDVSNPGDLIVATSLNSPAGEGVGNAIDNATSTKYLNFDKLNAGFTITLGRGSSIVSGIRLTSANDAPDRDPTSFVLSGSLDGITFTEVARGPVPAFAARFTAVQITFFNNNSYPQYRLLFPTVQNAGSAVAMQIAEVEFLGQVGPPPRPISDFVRSNIEPVLFGTGRTSAYLRFPFQVAAGAAWDDLSLLLRYDDGIAVYLNGVFVARANTPPNLEFDGVASTNRFRREAIQQQVFDLKPYANLFRAGTNILAVQAWNDRADSPDFLVQAQIAATRNRNLSQVYLDIPTPRAVNSSGKENIVPEPVLSENHGLFDQPFDLAITCAGPSPTIRYTVDGSLPTETNGYSYSGPIHLDHTTILRVAGVKEGWRTSRAITKTFIFPADVARQDRASALAAGFPPTWNGQVADYGLDSRVIGPADSYGGKYTRTFTNDLKTIPTMSIVMKTEDMFGPSGIYANPLNRGATSERPGSIEMIYPDGKPGFQADAGFRIQGGAFRNFSLTLKKSFRVIFRGKYGDATLHEPLFGTEAAGEINNFVLRANSNDAWPYFGSSTLYVRDTFAMESMRAMGRVASHCVFVHLYINGLYWGLYAPTERPDAAFAASYYGGDKADWDTINQDSVPDGNDLAWKRMLAMLSQDFTSDVPYQRIQGNNPDGTRNPAYENLLDVDDMIDYLILNFYIGNSDWPGRNWWAARDRIDGDGFKFHPWDSETALGITGVDANMLGVNSAVAAPYAALKKNASFRLRFADHVYKHFFNGGAFYVNPAASAWNPSAPENNRPAERLFTLSEQVRRAIVGESARWGDQLHQGPPYTLDEHWLTARNALLSGYFPRRSANVLQQFRNAGLYPKTDGPVMNVHGGRVDPGFMLALTAAQGTIYYTTNGTDPRFVTTALVYNGTVALSNSVSVKARVLNAGEWSALNEAAFTVGRPVLVISEIHYHPAKPDAGEKAAGFQDADDFEFLELHNSGNAAYDLTGVAFTDGIQFGFTNAAIKQLGAGAYVVLVRNQAAFERRYGAGLPMAGEYQGKLDNAGERVRAVNARGEVILDVTYGVSTPWPAGPDGLGPSLEFLGTGPDLTNPENWRESLQSGGSPGRENPQPPLLLEILGSDAGAIRATFRGKKGFGYTVYSTDTLASGSVWSILQKGEPLAEDSWVSLVLGSASSGRARFFRISIP